MWKVYQDPLDIEMYLYLFFKVNDEICYFTYGVKTVSSVVILVQHLFSKVGDFGLARWQPDGDMGVETRVIGTFG
jgi:hypothetical protein